MFKCCAAIFTLTLTANAYADEWRYCDVVNVTASEKEAAIQVAKIDKKIAFFKKPNFASITIFLDGKTWATSELIPTGRRIYGSNEPFEGYADKTNSLIVQEFESSDAIYVRMLGKVDFTFYSKCK